MTINPPTITNGSDNTIMFQVYSSTGYKNGLAISSTDNVTRLYAKPFGSGTQNALEIHTYNNTDINAVTIKANGNVGIGTTSPTYKLHVAGDIYTTTGFKKNGSSDSYVLLGGGGHKALSNFAMASNYVKKSGDTMSGVLTIDTTNFGALTIKRNDDTNGASIQFRGKSSVYGYLGLNNSTKDNQFLRWNSDTSRVYTILDTSSTYTSNGKGVINGTTITQVDNASKLQTARNLWGNSFDGTRDINGSIIFPDIGDTATSNKISWSSSSDGADIYY